MLKVYYLKVWLQEAWWTSAHSGCTRMGRGSSESWRTFAETSSPALVLGKTHPQLN